MELHCVDRFFSSLHIHCHPVTQSKPYRSVKTQKAYYSDSSSATDETEN